MQLEYLRSSWVHCFRDALCNIRSLEEVNVTEGEIQNALSAKSVQLSIREHLTEGLMDGPAGGTAAHSSD
jgi:hypothetical protein